MDDECEVKWSTGFLKSGLQLGSRGYNTNMDHVLYLTLDLKMSILTALKATNGSYR